MTAICGAFHRDGRPAAPDLLWRLAEAAPHRGAPRSVLLRGPLAMAELEVNPARASRLPVAPNRRGPCAIVLAGLLSNRLEIMDRLGVRRHTRHRTAADVRDGAGAAAASDSSLILHAYEAWGEECADRLAGDFAFAIWDEARRAVHLVRDAVGVKPLCYYLDSSRLIWASEIRQVLQGEITLAPNPGFAAECLAFDIRSRTDTLYQNVQRLPPGQWLTVEANRTRSARYFVLERACELRHDADADYAERFRELFADAVNVRAEDRHSVAAFLSGGVDSSSVVCTARALGHELETFSLLFPDVPEADEREFIAHVVQHARVGTAHLLDAGRGTIDRSAYRARGAARRDLLELPGDAVAVPLLSAMRARGFDVALSGAGGDHGFTGSAFHYADLLRERQWRALWRQFAADRQTADVGWSALQVVTCGLRLLLPQPVRQTLRPLLRGLTGQRTVPRHIGTRFAHDVGLVDRLRRPPTSPGVPESRAHVCRLFDDGWTAWLLESGERSGAEHGVDVRHPFFDRRIVEFAVAIPESQRWRDTTTKYVVRQALRDYLPRAVYSREGKADGSTLVIWAVDALGGRRALTNLAIASLGWVDAAELIALHDAARGRHDSGDADYCGALFSIWMALALEAWYRAEFVEGPNHGRQDRSDCQASDLLLRRLAGREPEREAVLSTAGAD